MAVIGPNQPDGEELVKARDLMQHRGPDDSGAWTANEVWLGSRRLAILDRTDSGHQPMERDGYALAFNGEIYNYVELRDELATKGHRFFTGSDTEVVLAAYREWGPSCLARFNGMWGIALWDPRQKLAFLARDRYGVKPFFYRLGRDRLIVASEPKVILALEPDCQRPDELMLYRLLADKRLDLRGRSFYAGIASMPPGHFAQFRPGDTSLEPRPYWAAPEEQTAFESIGEALERFRHLFEDSVRLRFRSDVPVGLTLSGGIDSTAVLEAAMAITGGSRLKAFTSVYEGQVQLDEREWARTAARRHPSVELIEVKAGPQSWLDTLDEIVWHMDSPGYSPAVFPLWLIMREARSSGVPVLLEGQGADELLGGYSLHSATAMRGLLTGAMARPSSLTLRRFAGAARTAAGTHGARRLLAETAMVSAPVLSDLNKRRRGTARVLNADFRTAATAVDELWPIPQRQESDRVDAVLYHDFVARTLPGFLHYGDTISMAHSVESRLPFMDYRLVEFCHALRSEFKVRDGRTKALLREYLVAVGQPTIAARVDKRGYPTPVADWLAAENGQLLFDLLLDPQARSAPYVNRHALKRLIHGFLAGRRIATDQLYSLVATEMWLRRCVARQPTPGFSRVSDIT